MQLQTTPQVAHPFAHLLGEQIIPETKCGFPGVKHFMFQDPNEQPDDDDENFDDEGFGL